MYEEEADKDDGLEKLDEEEDETSYGHMKEGEDEELDEGEDHGDKSKTHKGEKDFTTKKGDKLKHSGKGRGEKKGDEAFKNEALDNEDLVNEITRRVASRLLALKNK